MSRAPPVRHCIGRTATIADVRAGFPGAERSCYVRSADGVRLRTVHLPSPAGRGVGVVLAPGFSCSWNKAFVRRVAHGLVPYAGVVAVDLRGQGRSGGRCTLGDREPLDVDAAVAQARGLGYDRVVTLGFSMGGAAVLRHAALLAELTTHPVDAVISVSAASRWWRLELPRMRRLARLATTRTGRGVTRLALRTRIEARAEYGTGPGPADVVGRIAPVPLLLVHGGRDSYLTADNADELYAAAGEPRELWLWPDYGHAELALDARQVAQIGAHLPTLLARVGLAAPSRRAGAAADPDHLGATMDRP